MAQVQQQHHTKCNPICGSGESRVRADLTPTPWEVERLLPIDPTQVQTMGKDNFMQ